MRRPRLTGMLGRLLDGLAVASLGLALGAGVLWWRSYLDPEHFWVCRRWGAIDSLKTHRGEFTVARRRTPYRMRQNEFFHESGPRVLNRLARGTYPVERRWGPLAYAAVPAPAPPGAGAEEDAEALHRAAREFDLTPAPADPAELAEWTLLRGRAYARATQARRRINDSKASLWLVSFPALLPLSLLLALPAARAVPIGRRWQSQRRARAALCGKCGYDLSATPGRCPQCGETAGAARGESLPEPSKPPTPAADTVASGSAADAVYLIGPRPTGRLPAYARDRPRSRPPPRRPRPTY